MSLPRWKIMQWSGLKRVNIFELAKMGIEWEKVSGKRYYIRIGMLSFQTPLDTPSCFADFVSSQWTLARCTVNQIAKPVYRST